MGKENWYVIQTLSAHESRIKLMCEERIHKDILKKCVMPVCEEKNDSMENGILEKKDYSQDIYFQ